MDGSQLLDDAAGVGSDWKAKSTGNIVRVDDRYKHATAGYVIVCAKYLKTGRTRLYRLDQFLDRFESMQLSTRRV